MVTSKPSSTQAIPRAMITSQGNRLHGRRSTRAGTSVSNTPSLSTMSLDPSVWHTAAITPGRPNMDDFAAEVEATIARWHGISAPNDPARRMAAERLATIRAFQALHGTLVFEDEPSSFEAALHDAKE